MSKEAMQQALDALVLASSYCDTYDAIDALREALASPQPAQRQPLTGGEIYTAYITATNQTLRPQDERLAFAFARAIEAAHDIKEKT